ncbi:hypothetical protein PGB90_000111 [Kerria lacca]
MTNKIYVFKFSFTFSYFFFFKTSKMLIPHALLAISTVIDCDMCDAGVLNFSGIINTDE